MPKLPYTLRSFQCYINRELLKGMDNEITVAARQICKVAFDANVWTIATMPVKYEGIGRRLSTDVDRTAYLASTAVSNDLTDRMLSINCYLQEDAGMAHWDSAIL